MQPHSGIGHYSLSQLITQEVVLDHTVASVQASAFELLAATIKTITVRPVAMDSTQSRLKHVREVLGMTPLHGRPLPINAWRILMDFLAAEHSFCYNIIPHFHETSVFMCVAPASSSLALAASIPDLTE